MNERIRCEICAEIIATIDPDTIKDPFSGRDFGSVDPVHGMPPPWHPDLTWVDMKCPYGPHRPFLHPGRLLLENGEYLELNGRGGSPPSSPATDGGEATGLPGPDLAPPSTLTCEICGKECESKAGLAVHMTRKHK